MKNLKNNQLVLTNILSLGVDILHEISGNEVSNKISKSKEDTAMALATRMNANLSKYKGEQK